MGDDEVRPAPELKPEHPAAFDPAHASPETGDTESALAASEPTMAAAGADLAPPEPPAETFAPPPPPEERQRGSIMPALLAVIGLVLIGLLGVNLYTMANPPNRDALPALQSDLTGLKSRVAALETRPDPGAAVGPLEGRIKTLEDKVGELASQLGDARAALTAPPAAASAQPADDKLGALDQRTAALESGLSDAKAALAAVPKPDLAPMEARIAELANGVDSLKAGLAAVPKVDLGPIEGRIAALDDRLKPIETELSAAKSAERVTVARQEGSAAETRAAPLAVTAQAILRALDDGQPFAPAVAALQSLGASEAQLAPLKAVAATGAPTRAALAAEFADLRDRVLTAGTPTITGTVLDRMVSSAKGLVQVRPAGARPGSTPDAIVSRITDDLDRGDLAAALGEWEQLPEAGRAASAPWAGKLKQRVAAETAARAISAGAIAAIGSAP